MIDCQLSVGSSCIARLFPDGAAQEESLTLATGLCPRRKHVCRLLGRSSGFRFFLLAPLPTWIRQWISSSRPRLQRRDRAGFTPASLLWPDGGHPGLTPAYHQFAPFARRL